MAQPNTQQKIVEILKAYKSGYTTADLSDAYKISRAVIYSWIKKAHLDVRGARVDWKTIIAEVKKA